MVATDESLKSVSQGAAATSSPTSPSTELLVKEGIQRGGWRERIARWNECYLLLPKLIYFTLNCAIYATHNYTAIYFYEMWKLEVYQFGAVSSLSAVQFVGALFWAHLADKTGRHKSILLVCTVLYAFFFCLLNLEPFRDASQTTHRIVYSAIMYGLSCFFVSCMFPLVDAQVFSILARDPTFTKATFGRQRLWGTVGHGVITLAVGTSIQLKGYIGMFAILVLSCTAFIFFVLVGVPSDVRVIKGAASKKHHHQKEENQTSAVTNAVVTIDTDPAADEEHGGSLGCAKRMAMAPVIRVLLDPHFFFLAVVILCAGYVRSVMSNFLGFYMEHEMQKSKVLIGVAVAFRMASEIAIFFYNKPLLQFLGLHWMLIIAQLAGLLRVLAYSLLPASGNWFYLSFAIELLKGTSTGCLISSGVRMADDIAPRGCRNTAQAYISGIYSGLSLAIGGALGGFLIFILPGNSIVAMFRVTFYMGLAALIMCLLKYSLVDRAILVPSSWRHQKSTEKS
jgi:Na+/melibiose symporter-like transporter